MQLGGESRETIAIEGQSTPTLAFAAAELARYLQASLGVRAAVGKGAVRFVLAATSTEAPPLLDAKADRFTLTFAKNTVRIEARRRVRCSPCVRVPQAARRLPLAWAARGLRAHPTSVCSARSSPGRQPARVWLPGDRALPVLPRTQRGRDRLGGQGGTETRCTWGSTGPTIGKRWTLARPSRPRSSDAGSTCTTVATRSTPGFRRASSSRRTRSTTLCTTANARPTVSPHCSSLCLSNPAVLDTAVEHMRCVPRREPGDARHRPVEYGRQRLLRMQRLPTASGSVAPEPLWARTTRHAGDHPSRC